MLAANFKDFNDYMREHSEPGYHIFVAKNDLSVDELNNPISDKEVIKIVPVIQGSGAVGRIILGAVLIVASVVFSEFLGPYAPYVMNLGVSMVIGGVVQLLFAPPQTKSPSDEKANNAPSYSFDGAVNTTRQGNPVAVGYGRLRVGSQVISAGLFSEPI